MADSQDPGGKTDNVTNIEDARRKARGGNSKKSASRPSSQPKRNFNHKKVAEIKAAIAAGTYSINAQRIADKFIEKENP